MRWKPRFAIFEGIFDIDAKKQTIDTLSSDMSRQDFWNDEQHSTSVMKQLKSLKAAVEPWESAFRKYGELREMTDIVTESDVGLIEDLERNMQVLQRETEQLEFKTLLSGEADPSSAILSINAGAGGTESCDWASMLLRMYMRWAEARGYGVKTLDILPGEEAGTKNATLLIDGPYAFGYLKAERGVHRLVRISPFDSNKRRHTSFVSVDVIPDLGAEIAVTIDEKDLAIETFRASGAGGQHMQKSDTAVRIVHKPTGIVAQCQNERSQHQNKETALKILKARLYELEQEKKEQELQKHSAEKKKIEWGSQIRSYVLHPYNMVKDHRTEHETGNTAAVLDGKLDEFIEAYLRLQADTERS